MKPNPIFILLLFFLQYLRIFTGVLLFFIPSSRKNFEKKNLNNKTNLGSIADFCFEVSSEGELEQVRPLIIYFLDQGKKIEIIFSSPSVETKCIDLENKFKSQVRIFRLPIITLQSVHKWVTAPVIIFCRYDFFPELLLLKLRGKKLILLSGAVKKNSWYKKNAFKMFSVIVAASQNEEILFSKINPEAQLFTFDFRIQRITERWTLAKKVLNEIPLLKNYLSYLNEIPVNNRIILGSAWESDLQIFNDPGFIDDIKNSQVHVAIVPHKLNEENIKNIISHLEKLGLANYVSILNENSRPNSIVIVNRSGILCELYGNFHHSYIGGGFERSIHSVFEPFFSGSMVYCGPKFHRSTEYDLIKEIAPHEIQVLFQAEKFYTVYMQYKNLNLNLEVRDQWRQVASVKISQIASAIDVK